MDRPLTVPEAAEILNYHPDHLGRLLREARVQGERVGGRWMITHQEVERSSPCRDRAGDCPSVYLNNRHLPGIAVSITVVQWLWISGVSCPSSTPPRKQGDQFWSPFFFVGDG